MDCKGQVLKPKWTLLSVKNISCHFLYERVNHACLHNC